MPDIADAVPVTRHFVTVGDGRVHYRRAGRGPAVVLLHDSPRSSRLHIETMRALADRFTVFALDTPGYGNSTPIGIAAPVIGDFATALGAALAALGLSRAPLYATHTSAKIALDHAAGAGQEGPALLLLDGLSIPLKPTDEAFIAAYMRPFRIDAAGAYLAAEWTRMRDMLRWFPWFDARPAARMRTPAPDAAWTAAYMLDLLSAGPHYADAYAAAMRYDPRPALRSVRGRTIVAARASDVLYASLDLVPEDRGANVTVERLPDDRSLWLDWLGRTLGSATAGGSTATPASPPDRSGPAYVSLAHGQMLVHREGRGGNRPLLILETPTLLHAHAWQRALRHRATIVPELPGYGESDRLEGARLDDHADALAAMLAFLGTGRVDLLAIDLAAPLALRLTARHPHLIAMLAVDGIGGAAGVDAARLCPAFAQGEAGEHLHRIWHMLRDGEAQWPWFDAGVAAQRRIVPLLEAEALHGVLLDVLKQPACYGDAARAGLEAGAVVPGGGAGAVLLFDHPDDPGYAGVAALAARMPQARIVDRPDDIAAAAERLDALLAEPLVAGMAL